MWGVTACQLQVVVLRMSSWYADQRNKDKPLIRWKVAGRDFSSHVRLVETKMIDDIY
jgi:hypothetical protein